MAGGLTAIVTVVAATTTTAAATTSVALALGRLVGFVALLCEIDKIIL